MKKEEIANLFRAHYMDMYRLAMTMLYDEEESKDVVSDVFARLVDGIVEVRTETAESYLLSCVRNKCLNAIAHKRTTERFARLMTRQKDETVRADEDMIRLDELLKYIDNNLPPLSRSIFRLRFLKEMSYQEVADELGVSKVTVFNHLSQSLEKINAYFKDK